jgi:hypothetical protein
MDIKEKFDLMCTVTLTYDENNALARKKLAALLKTGLFLNVSEENKSDEVQAYKEERDAFLASSKKSMSHIISRYL